MRHETDVRLLKKRYAYDSWAWASCATLRRGSLEERVMEMRDKSRLTAHCPQCAARIQFSREPELGDLMTCPECDNRLEVVALSPIKLDWVWEQNEAAQDTGRE